jgi:hypothetical protein
MYGSKKIVIWGAQVAGLDPFPGQKRHMIHSEAICIKL